jgi:hypothetical protein
MAQIPHNCVKIILTFSPLNAKMLLLFFA